MSQSAKTGKAPAGARPVVIRGDNPVAVARAVRAAVGDGLVIPAGPFRYPYAAVVHLLREAGTFHDPEADTADDAMVTREALVDQLWKLLRQDVHVGVALADKLDHASAQLLSDFAATARVAVSHGYRAGGLVIGTCGSLAPCLRLEGTDIRDVRESAAPSPVLSRGAARVLAVMQAAPHPVPVSSLITASDIGARATEAAIRELASGDLLDVGSRIALGPGGETSGAQSAAWLETPELRLPLARLAVQPDREQSRRVAHEAAARNEHELAFWCMSGASPESAFDVLLFARSAVACGRPEIARTLVNPLLGTTLRPAEVLAVAIVLALLVPSGLVEEALAESWLRRAEREGCAGAARPWRAGLLAAAGNAPAALTLLRRTTAAELSGLPPAARLEHEFAALGCALQLGDARTAARKLRRVAPLCVDRTSRRTLAEHAVSLDESAEPEFLRLCAMDMDAGRLAAGTPAAVQAALATLMSGAP